jgi:GNAT superfamily N-acetyltransferase
MPVRPAVEADTDQMVNLSEAFRMRLASYSPVFWHVASDAREKQTTWFKLLIGLGDTVAIVNESRGQVTGFIIGRLTPAPPVYAPGGPVCLIDDFCVEHESAWSTTGAALLAAVEAEAKRRGAPLSVVVCAHLDGAKRAFLAAQGFATTSEWHVRPLSSS